MSTHAGGRHGAPPDRWGNAWLSSTQLLANALGDEGRILFGIKPEAPRADEIHGPGGLGLIDKFEDCNLVGGTSNENGARMGRFGGEMDG